MKTVTIRKSSDFSPNSNVAVHFGLNRLHIKGFGPFTLNLEPGQVFYASHQWVKSKKIHYNDILGNSSYQIKPRLDKSLAAISFIVLIICLVIFFVTKFRWSFIPMVPIAFYILLYLTILKDRYLILKQEKGISE